MQVSRVRGNALRHEFSRAARLAREETLKTSS
jgi:hypothetical protein